MKTIAEENLVSFKNLEQDAFAYVSQLGREMTQIMLRSMIQNWQRDGIKTGTVIKGRGAPQLRHSMEKWFIPGEYTTRTPGRKIAIAAHRT